MSRLLRRLPTPDLPPSVTYKTVSLTVPSNADLERFLWGALLSICYWTSWDEVGTMTESEAAEFMKAVLDSRREFDMLGAVVPVFREALSSSMLLCDGGVYNKSDYPELWDVWPSAMKSATDLTLPDLRNLFLVGAGLDYSRGDTGGAAEVTLTVGEIPSHSHGNLPHSHAEGIAVPSVGEVSPGVPVPSAVPSAGTTAPASITIQDTGGGGAHENRPPFYAVVYAVIARH
jgi:microcystin-dependent protein